jgi:hypothetical protein
MHNSLESVKEGHMQGVVRPSEETMAAMALPEQWELISQPFEETRAASIPAVDRTVAFALPLQAWSSIATPPNGALSFFQVASKGHGISLEFLEQPSAVPEMTTEIPIAG